MITVGARVCLNSQGAAIWNANMKPRVDWHGRCGRVHHLYRRTPDASVIWDGNHTQSWVPLKFLEPEGLQRDPQRERRHQGGCPE